MTTAIERRIAELERLVAPPEPSDYDRALAACPWVRWATVDELMALDDLFHETRTATFDDMAPADQARAAAIVYGIEARRLAGEPSEDEKK
jgi:hypothetical protein